MILGPETHSKTWGNELWISNCHLYCGKILTVEKDKFCSLHMHVKKTEDFYILKGSVKFEYQDGSLTSKGVAAISPLKEAILCKGTVVRVEPYTLHRFTGLDDENQIIEISTQHFEDDSYRLVPSCT